jgi:hypothetical protein
MTIGAGAFKGPSRLPPLSFLPVQAIVESRTPKRPPPPAFRSAVDCWGHETQPQRRTNASWSGCGGLPTRRTCAGAVACSVCPGFSAASLAAASFRSSPYTSGNNSSAARGSPCSICDKMRVTFDTITMMVEPQRVRHQCPVATTATIAANRTIPRCRSVPMA